jgi:hypothetical protein
MAVLDWTDDHLSDGRAVLYIAAAYLLLMPQIGILVYFTRGGKPRWLLRERVCPYARLVVATGSANGSDWWEFYGGSYTLNSLLNKPLYRNGNTRASRLLRVLLQIIILSQWVLVAGSKYWNALLISFLILFCACVSTYVYSPEESMQDWLWINCNVVI